MGCWSLKLLSDCCIIPCCIIIPTLQDVFVVYEYLGLPQQLSGLPPGLMFRDHFCRLRSHVGCQVLNLGGLLCSRQLSYTLYYHSYSRGCILTPWLSEAIFWLIPFLLCIYPWHVPPNPDFSINICHSCLIFPSQHFYFMSCNFALFVHFFCILREVVKL